MEQSNGFAESKICKALFLSYSNIGRLTCQSNNFYKATQSADKLRGSVEPTEYKHVVLSLFFRNFASDKFEECKRKIIENQGEKYADMKPFYTQKNVCYLLEESCWPYIIENAKQDNIALKIDTALYMI